MKDSSSASVSYLLSKLSVFAVIVVGCLVAVIFGMQIGESEYVKPYLVLLICLGISIALALGSKVWLLIPIGFSLIDFPVIPLGIRSFELSEITVMATFSMFLCRIAMGRQHFYLVRIEYIAVFLYTMWAMFIFINNPSGLAILGSSSVGARFYFKIGLAFLAVLILANQTISSKEAKYTLWIILIGAMLSIVWLLVRVFVLKNFMVSQDANFGYQSFYGWHQYLAPPASIFICYIFARYKMAELFTLKKAYLLFVLLIAYFFVAQSGKRAVFAVAVIYPIIAALYRREYMYCFVIGVFASLLVAFIVLGQGKMFDLPLRVQRVFVNLPGDWDRRVVSSKGGSEALDKFRQELAEEAIRRIEKKPFVGPGFATEVKELLAFTKGQGLNEIEAHAYTGNWHSIWLGIAATFGIPAAIMWAIYWYQMVSSCLWILKRTRLGESQYVLTLMIFMMTIASILRSFTTGHAANSPYAEFWMFGMIIALKYTIKKQGSEKVMVSNIEKGKTVASSPSS